jgi:UDP-glucose-4-epimerase GalE
MTMVRSILVTGGCGYIGSHTCKALASAGFQPVAFDNLSTGNRWAAGWGPLVEGDIMDRRAVRRALERYQIDAVIHFAAKALVGESMRSPFEYLHDNVSGSVTLLEAMREAGVRHIVISSTCATYGVPQTVPISEMEPQTPVNPYGESKLYVERALIWYERVFGIRSVALRYFNAAGADPDGEIGECHEPETHLIPLVIQAALGLRPAVHIMGTDYPTPDGTCIRDYIHVEDLASAHIKALKYLKRGGRSTALNLGTSRGYSVREVIASVERAGGLPVPVQESGRRAGDPPVLVADARRAQKVLSWRPRYKNLDDIVSTAWQWHSSLALTGTEVLGPKRTRRESVALPRLVASAGGAHLEEAETQIQPGGQGIFLWRG